MVKRWTKKRQTKWSRDREVYIGEDNEMVYIGGPDSGGYGGQIYIRDKEHAKVIYSFLKSYFNSKPKQGERGG
jgi:GTPase involved in cell partitioning and DNA repair